MFREENKNIKKEYTTNDILNSGGDSAENNTGLAATVPEAVAKKGKVAKEKYNKAQKKTFIEDKTDLSNKAEILQDDLHDQNLKSIGDAQYDSSTISAHNDPTDKDNMNGVSKEVSGNSKRIRTDPDAFKALGFSIEGKTTTDPNEIGMNAEDNNIHNTNVHKEYLKEVGIDQDKPIYTYTKQFLNKYTKPSDDKKMGFLHYTIVTALGNLWDSIEWFARLPEFVGLYVGEKVGKLIVGTEENAQKSNESLKTAERKKKYESSRLGKIDKAGQDTVKYLSDKFIKDNTWLAVDTIRTSQYYKDYQEDNPKLHVVGDLIALLITIVGPRGSLKLVAKGTRAVGAMAGVKLLEKQFGPEAVTAAAKKAKAAAKLSEDQIIKRKENILTAYEAAFRVIGRIAEKLNLGSPNSTANLILKSKKPAEITHYFYNVMEPIIKSSLIFAGLKTTEEIERQILAQHDAEFKIKNNIQSSSSVERELTKQYWNERKNSFMANIKLGVLFHMLGWGVGAVAQKAGKAIKAAWKGTKMGKNELQWVDWLTQKIKGMSSEKIYDIKRASEAVAEEIARTKNYTKSLLMEEGLSDYFTNVPFKGKINSEIRERANKFTKVSNSQLRSYIEKRKKGELPSNRSPMGRLNKFSEEKIAEIVQYRKDIRVHITGKETRSELVEKVRKGMDQYRVDFWQHTKEEEVRYLTDKIESYPIFQEKYSNFIRKKEYILESATSKAQTSLIEDYNLALEQQKYFDIIEEKYPAFLITGEAERVVNLTKELVDPVFGVSKKKLKTLKAINVRAVQDFVKEASLNEKIEFLDTLGEHFASVPKYKIQIEKNAASKSVARQSYNNISNYIFNDKEGVFQKYMRGLYKDKRIELTMEDLKIFSEKTEKDRKAAWKMFLENIGSFREEAIDQFILLTAVETSSGSNRIASTLAALDPPFIKKSGREIGRWLDFKTFSGISTFLKSTAMPVIPMSARVTAEKFYYTGAKPTLQNFISNTSSITGVYVEPLVSFARGLFPSYIKRQALAVASGIKSISRGAKGLASLSRDEFKERVMKGYNSVLGIGPDIMHSADNRLKEVGYNMLESVFLETVEANSNINQPTKIFLRDLYKNGRLSEIFNKETRDATKKEIFLAIKNAEEPIKDDLKIAFAEIEFMDMASDEVLGKGPMQAFNPVTRSLIWFGQLPPVKLFTRIMRSATSAFITQITQTEGFTKLRAAEMRKTILDMTEKNSGVLPLEGKIMKDYLQKMEVVNEAARALWLQITFTVYNAGMFGGAFDYSKTEETEVGESDRFKYLKKRLKEREITDEEYQELIGLGNKYNAKRIKKAEKSYFYNDVGLNLGNMVVGGHNVEGLELMMGMGATIAIMLRDLKGIELSPYLIKKFDIIKGALYIFGAGIVESGVPIVNTIESARKVAQGDWGLTRSAVSNVMMPKIASDIVDISTGMFNNKDRLGKAANLAFVEAHDTHAKAQQLPIFNVVTGKIRQKRRVMGMNMSYVEKPTDYEFKLIKLGIGRKDLGFKVVNSHGKVYSEKNYRKIMKAWNEPIDPESEDSPRTLFLKEVDKIYEDLQEMQREKEEVFLDSGGFRKRVIEAFRQSEELARVNSNIEDEK